ncbi:MAG: hypothetical protein ACLQIB_29235 [Isosphaeraceae bacterium]
MSGIDEFQRQLRGEVAAGRERIETMQTQAAEQSQRQTERGGVTNFLTEESQTAFEQDPSRYVGGSQ